MRLADADFEKARSLTLHIKLSRINSRWGDIMYHFYTMFASLCIRLLEVLLHAATYIPSKSQDKLLEHPSINVAGTVYIFSPQLS